MPESLKNKLIITEFRQDVKSYNDELEEILATNRPHCPCCGHKMHIHSKYGRYFIIEQEVLRLKIFKLRCANQKCKHTHALLPDFIAPYRHYPIILIAEHSECELTIEQSAEVVGCDEQVIKRWRRRLRTIKPAIISALCALKAKIVGYSSKYYGSNLKDCCEYLGLATGSRALWSTINIGLATDYAQIWL